MDVTLEVMLPRRGDPDWTNDVHPRYRTLSFVALYDHLKQTNVVGMAVTGYIHILNLPVEYFFPLERIVNADGRAVNQRRAWYLQWQRIPKNVRDTLLVDRQITIDWTVIRSWARNQIESRDITVADLTQ